MAMGSLYPIALCGYFQQRLHLCFRASVGSNEWVNTHVHTHTLKTFSRKELNRMIFTSFNTVPSEFKRNSSEKTSAVFSNRAVTPKSELAFQLHLVVWVEAELVLPYVSLPLPAPHTSWASLLYTIIPLGPLCTLTEPHCSNQNALLTQWRTAGAVWGESDNADTSQTDLLPLERHIMNWPSQTLRCYPVLPCGWKGYSLFNGKVLGLLPKDSHFRCSTYSPRVLFPHLCQLFRLEHAPRWEIITCQDQGMSLPNGFHEEQVNPDANL